MTLVQIAEEKNEIEASIIKGYLESVGIEASIGTTNNNEILHAYNAITNVPFGVYVEEDRVEEAKRILVERGM